MRKVKIEEEEIPKSVLKMKQEKEKRENTYKTNNTEKSKHTNNKSKPNKRSKHSKKADMDNAEEKIEQKKLKRKVTLYFIICVLIVVAAYLGVSAYNWKVLSEAMFNNKMSVVLDKEGEVILKKYSPIGELSEFATGYAETLSKTTGHIACITDKDSVIAVSGGSKKEYLEKAISPELEKIIENKEVYTSKDNNEKALPITQNANTNNLNNSQVIYPIISDGDVIGSIVLLSKEQSTKMGDSELKVAQSAAGFLSSQMEI